MVSPKSLLIALAAVSYGSAQSFGQTPLLGYNSYNHVACSPDEVTMRTQINAMVDRGFLAAGYSYFTVDCGWAARDGQRNASSGALKIDTNRFPSGLQPLSDLARSRGLRWSMYSDAGVRMCDTEAPSPVLGSLGHEAVDADFFKALGAEFLKYDNCYVDSPTDNAPKVPRDDFVRRFSVMWNELKRVGIPGMNICQWGAPFSTSTGLQGPATWTKGISTGFRLSDDIARGWNNVYRIYNQVIHIAAADVTGPGFFADADMLEVGNPGMTFDEQATHFAAWAMFKSPLMIGTDVTALNPSTVQLLQNRALLAINQDPVGKMIRLVQRWHTDRDLWSGPLSNGDIAVLVTDLSNTRRTLSVQFADLGIASATVLDVFAGTSSAGRVNFSKSVNAHGSLALRLSNVTRTTTAPAAPRYTYIAASSGALASGANIQPCGGCTSGQKVGFVGGSNSGVLTFTNIRTSATTQNVLFDYINGEVGYLGGLNNERVATVSVNGGPAKTVSFPLSGYNWDRDVARGWKVELGGFLVGKANNVTIKGVNGGFAPDFDRVGFVA